MALLDKMNQACHEQRALPNRKCEGGNGPQVASACWPALGWLTGWAERAEHTRANDRFAEEGEEAAPQPLARGRRGVSKRISGGSRVRDGEARQIIVCWKGSILTGKSTRRSSVFHPSQEIESWLGG